MMPGRLEMLEEAIEVIRGLWEGEYFSHEGDYYIQTTRSSRTSRRPVERANPSTVRRRYADLPTPRHFESVLEFVTKEQVAEGVLCKQDPESHFKKINECRDEGFDHICAAPLFSGEAGPISSCRRPL